MNDVHVQFVRTVYKLAHLLSGHFLPGALEQLWCHEAWSTSRVVPYP